MAKLKDIDLLKIGHTIQLAGGVWVGEGKAYLVMFPEDYGHLDMSIGGFPVLVPKYIPGTEPEANLLVESLNMDRAEWETFLRQTDLLETEILTEAADKTLTKSILRKSTRQIDQGVSWQVFKRDGYACRYCGNDDTPLTVDHLVLWEEGGPSIVSNLLAACRRCNKTRGNMQYTAWLESPYYLKVSRNLSSNTLNANQEIAATLEGVPRRIHQKSR